MQIFYENAIWLFIYTQKPLRAGFSSNSPRSEIAAVPGKSKKTSDIMIISTHRHEKQVTLKLASLMFYNVLCPIRFL